VKVSEECIQSAEHARQILYIHLGMRNTQRLRLQQKKAALQQKARDNTQ